MKTACFSLPFVANGSVSAAVAARAEAVSQVARFYTGPPSPTRDLKYVSVISASSFGSSVISSKAGPRKAAVSLDALDLESDYTFSKQTRFDTKADLNFERSDSCFGTQTSFFSEINLSIVKKKTLEVDDTEEPVSAGTTLYVSNLPWTCNQWQVADLFEKAGDVDTVKVRYDRVTGRSRGFAIVTMGSLEEAEYAIAKLDGYQLGGRAIRVNFPPPNAAGTGIPDEVRFQNGYAGGDDNLSKIFVGNLPWGVDDAALRKLFDSHGSIVDARVVYDRDTGKSRGFGFVTFSSPGAANRAVSERNGTNYEGRPLTVMMKRPVTMF